MLKITLFQHLDSSCLDLTFWFQQVGAPPHYDRNVRHYHDLSFHQRWIGKRGSLESEWLARSLDLSPLDFFLWGNLNDKVFKTKPNSLEELKDRIVQESQRIPVIYVLNSVNSFYHHLAHCQITQRKHTLSIYCKLSNKLQKIM